MHVRDKRDELGEDDEIHCLKEGGVADDAGETVKGDTATLYLSASTASLEADDVDPFADNDIEEELEKNKVILDDC